MHNILLEKLVANGLFRVDEGKRFSDGKLFYPQLLSCLARWKIKAPDTAVDVYVRGKGYEEEEEEFFVNGRLDNLIPLWLDGIFFLSSACK
ncbi:hypothetical protein CDAR_237781 [Caerostris darwini]|uniref:Uncharacterized protein n=1 Tax=Caerostris darwini TaxID=1538125 RepID=A0AAV4S4P2_9ARAC|nr:hypothetical protein CDAR_237781 [Caerostris darwini]